MIQFVFSLIAYAVAWNVATDLSMAKFFIFGLLMFFIGLLVKMFLPIPTWIATYIGGGIAWFLMINQPLTTFFTFMFVGFIFSMIANFLAALVVGYLVARQQDPE